MRILPAVVTCCLAAGVAACGTREAPADLSGLWSVPIPSDSATALVVLEETAGRITGSGAWATIIPATVFGVRRDRSVSLHLRFEKLPSILFQGQVVGSDTVRGVVLGDAGVRDSAVLVRVR